MSAETRLKVLLLADQCNPEWPSLPIVGFKYAVALSQCCDVTVVTQIRNKQNIRAVVPADSDALRFDFIDTEYVAKPLNAISMKLRGDAEKAWSTSQIMAYLPYLEFERQTWKRYRSDLKKHAYDVVHRITPMSPTLPSWMAGRAPVPFVLGPLNGNLDWPAAFTDEKRREGEGLRRLRDLAGYLPYARRTWKRSDAVLAAFQHTIDDLDRVAPQKIVPFPEVGFDEGIFYPPSWLDDDSDAWDTFPRNDDDARPDGGVTFLFAGRLVPYKLAEVAIRAFVGAEELVGEHRLRIVGDGPERDRLETLVKTMGAPPSVTFEGRKNQSGVADAMRSSDVFVFPSIRELGAGVVVEAMACGMYNLVVDYGGPADLVDETRGQRIALAPLEQLVEEFQRAMRRCVELQRGGKLTQARRAAAGYAQSTFRWQSKAEQTESVYRRLLAGAAPGDVR